MSSTLPGNSVAGQNLNLTAGTIDFTNGGLTDPALKLVAVSSSPSVTATLTVEGSVRKPKFTLASTPELPQDEILSQLLFNTNKSKLSVFQVAQIGDALASLAGGPSVIGGTLDSARTALGLDRLSVGSDTTGEPVVEGGRYLAPGVYFGAKQSTTGAGTKATVQIDLAKGLKVEATAGTSSTSATGSEGTSSAGSVGLTYQIEY